MQALGSEGNFERRIAGSDKGAVRMFSQHFKRENQAVAYSKEEVVTTQERSPVTCH